MMGNRLDIHSSVYVSVTEQLIFEKLQNTAMIEAKINIELMGNTLLEKNFLMKYQKYL